MARARAASSTWSPRAASAISSAPPITTTATTRSTPTTFSATARATSAADIATTPRAATSADRSTSPAKFNRDRQKLFFFFAQEYLPNQTPNGPRNYTVPTALERTGDFSQSFDKNGNLITITDPFTKAPFPGNKIPQNRIDPNMQKLLNIFPLPNYVGGKTSAGTGFNYQIQDVLERQGHNEFLRVDYNVSQNVRAFIRGSNGRTHNKGPASTVNRYPWMADANVDYTLGFPTLGGTVTWIVTPTLVNEASVGWAGWTEDQIYPQEWLSKLQRDKIGLTLGQLYPKSNPLNLIPSVNFSGIDNAARTQWEGRFPMQDIASTWSFTDSISKVQGKHTLKAGLQFEHVHYL